MAIVAENFKAYSKNTLKGFVDLKLEPSGMVIRRCTWHEKNGREWIGLPGAPQIDKDGGVKKDATTGKALYTAVVDFTGKEARDRFNDAALKAIYRLLGQGGVAAPINEDEHPFA